MRTRIIYLVTIAMALIHGPESGAQTDDSGQSSSTQFKIGMFYNSHLNYYGRVDSLKSAGVFPLAELWFDKSFYINLAPVFVQNVATGFQYAGTVATAGYRYEKEKKFVAHIYAVKPFYRESSDLVQSSLKAQFSSQFSKLTKVINITAGADVKLSNELDYGASAGLDKVIRISAGKKVVVALNPSVFVYAGTQRFSKTYFEKKRFLIFPTADQEVIEQVDRFKILSYEISSPIVVAKGKFQLIMIPSYVLPQNLLVVENEPQLSERGANLFYYTVGAKVTL